MCHLGPVWLDLRSAFSIFYDPRWNPSLSSVLAAQGFWPRPGRPNPVRALCSWSAMPGPGMKLLISGGGKCNITHDGTMEHVRSAFLPREARFLKPSFHTCTNREIRERLERQGVTTMVRDDERVFPASGRAKDVVDALVRPLHALGVEIRLGTKVEDITADAEGVSGARTSAGTISGRRIILATGGASYQKTGTTGDGFRWAAALGHTIVPIRPALAPIRIAPPLPSEWRGIAVRNGRLTVIVRGKHHASWAGDHPDHARRDFRTRSARRQQRCRPGPRVRPRGCVIRFLPGPGSCSARRGPSRAEPLTRRTDTRDGP